MILWDLIEVNITKFLSLLVLVFDLTGVGFHVKNIDMYLIWVLDSIHTLYASTEIKYHIFVFRQVLKKLDFHFKV